MLLNFGCCWVEFEDTIQDVLYVSYIPNPFWGYLHLAQDVFWTTRLIHLIGCPSQQQADCWFVCTLAKHNSLNYVFAMGQGWFMRESTFSQKWIPMYRPLYPPATASPPSFPLLSCNLHSSDSSGKARWESAYPSHYPNLPPLFGSTWALSCCD